jgi:hypothetical protein
LTTGPGSIRIHAASWAEALAAPVQLGAATDLEPRGVQGSTPLEIVGHESERG